MTAATKEKKITDRAVGLARQPPDSIGAGREAISLVGTSEIDQALPPSTLTRP